MTRIEVHLESPEIPAGSFIAKPKILYRSGNRYCRAEEADDPEHSVHGLMIVNEPDAWMIYLSDKTAQHIVNRGPTFDCRLPLFESVDPKDEAGMLYQDLQFGRELQFFKKMGAAGEPGPDEQGKKTTRYKIEIGNTKLLMFTINAPTERALAVGRPAGEKGEVYIYAAYDEIPFDPKLFAKPELSPSKK
jgi:hypothetical protein